MSPVTVGEELGRTEGVLEGPSEGDRLGWDDVVGGKVKPSSVGFSLGKFDGTADGAGELVGSNVTPLATEGLALGTDDGRSVPTPPLDGL